MRLLAIIGSIACFAACETIGGPNPTNSVGHVSPSHPASSQPSPSASPAGLVVSCGSFAPTLDALQAPNVSDHLVAEGVGCGSGQVPEDKKPLTVDSGSLLSLYFAVACDGPYKGFGDPGVIFSAHNTRTGNDLTWFVQPGPGGYGNGPLTDRTGPTSPAGTYVLRVTVVRQDIHRCAWHAAMFKR